MSKYDLQREVYYMVCKYYDTQPLAPDNDYIVKYIHALFNYNAKETKQAYKHWKELTL